MAERPLSQLARLVREISDPLALLVAAAAGVVAWFLNVPIVVSIGAAVGVLIVKVLASALLPQRQAPAMLSAADLRGPLTRREWEIVQLVADGLTNREIGATLFIAESSVDTHLMHVREKLGFHSRAEITRWTTNRRR